MSDLSKKTDSVKKFLSSRLGIEILIGSSILLCFGAILFYIIKTKNKKIEDQNKKIEDQNKKIEDLITDNKNQNKKIEDQNKKIEDLITDNKNQIDSSTKTNYAFECFAK
jgi:septal ring factor EnvC (AmiA/AmiB activator)